MRQVPSGQLGEAKGIHWPDCNRTSVEACMFTLGLGESEADGLGTGGASLGPSGEAVARSNSAIATL